MDETQMRYDGVEPGKDFPLEPVETEEQIRTRIRAEVIAEYQAMIDSRVSGAKKTFDRKREQEASERYERFRRLQMIEEEKGRKELETKEIELRAKGIRLDIVDLVDQYGLNSSFRNMIAYEDLLTIPDDRERYQRLKERVIDLKEEFDKLVNAEVAKQTTGLEIVRR